MSRCFPFPPPNYRKEEKILTESIKLQKEGEASKKKRKEKKRDKKEKRERSKDKKENSNDLERAHKKRKHNEANEPHATDLIKFSGAPKLQKEQEASKEKRKERKRDKKENRKRSKDEKENSKDSKDAAAEPLERSGLTEEHGPSCLPPEPCRSSESTQTSSKDRKQGTTIIRFKLPLRKHGDTKPAPVVSEEKPCFSGRAASEYTEPAPTKVDEPCSSGRVAEMAVEMELGESSKSHKRRRDKEGKFIDLVVDWKPTAFHVGDVEDLGWLLAEPKRKLPSSEEKSCNGCEDLSYGSSACSFQPRACYLPELDTYQLPYVIPF